MAPQACIDAPGVRHHIVIREIERAAIIKDNVDAANIRKRFVWTINYNRLEKIKNNYGVTHRRYCGAYKLVCEIYK